MSLPSELDSPLTYLIPRQTSGPWRQQQDGALLLSSWAAESQEEVDEIPGHAGHMTGESYEYFIDYTYSGGYLDPFETYPSTLPLDLVNRGVLYRLSVMTPRMIPSSGVKNPYLQSWLPLSLNNPTLFTALLFSSLTHKRVRWLLSGESGEPFETQDQHLLDLCYRQTIITANEALRDPAQAVTDTNILSVLMMIESAAMPPERDWNKESPFKAPLQSLHWLNIHGARVPNTIHQNGLSNLVRLRGGLQSINIPGVASAVFYRTLVNATLTLSRPQFPFFSVYGNVNPSLREYFDCGSGEYEFGFRRFYQFGLTAELAEVFLAMKSYSSVIEKYIGGDIAGPDTRMMCDQRNLIQFHLMSLPSSYELDQVERNYVYEACRISGLIYSVGVVFPLPGVGTPLPSLATLLKAELQDSTPYEKWPLPEGISILIWALTLGGIAATDMPERVWFVNVLSRYMEHAHISRWPQLKQTLKRILWLDSACDDAGERLWNEVEESLRESRQTGTPNSAVPQRVSTRPQPCGHCGRRRVKCDKETPCHNCVKHGLKCSYERINDLQPAAQQEILRRKRPCGLCRQRKIKCDSQNPCGNCVKGDFRCFYENSAESRQK